MVQNDDGEPIAASTVVPSATCSLPLINFLRGWPAPSLLPVHLLQTAATSLLRDHASDSAAQTELIASLQYAPDPGPLSLRKALATLLSSFYAPFAPPVPLSHISTTGGASQSLGVALTVTVDPHYTRAWILEPTYFLAAGIFADTGMRMEGVDVGGAEGEWDLSGLRERIEAVEREREETGKSSYQPPPHLAASTGRKVYRHIIYCVPTFSNPTGESMPRSIREELVLLARKFDALIICDDVYDFVYWDASPTLLSHPTKTHASNDQTTFQAVLPRLVDVDRTLDPMPEPSTFGNVLSNGSFSKIVAPGVRTGWVQSSTPALAHAISQAGVTRSGGAASNVTGSILAHALRNGALEGHIRETLVVAYARRWRLLVAAVGEHLVPLGVKLAGGRGTLTDSHARGKGGAGSLPEVVAGGFFVWLQLPPGLADGEVAARALRDANVAVATETQCRLPRREEEQGARTGRCVRLCFAFEPEEKMGEGVQRLRGVLEDMLRELKDGGATVGGVVSTTGPTLGDYA